MYIEEFATSFWLLGQPDEEVKKYFEVLPERPGREGLKLRNWLLYPVLAAQIHASSSARHDNQLWEERCRNPRIIDPGDVRFWMLLGALNNEGLPADMHQLAWLNAYHYKSHIDSYFVLQELNAVTYKQNPQGGNRTPEANAIRAAAQATASRLALIKQEVEYLDQLGLTGVQ